MNDATSRRSTTRPQGGILAAELLLISLVSAASAEPELERIQIEPPMVRLNDGRDRQQVAVSGRYADGSVRDLTRLAKFSVEPSTVAAVDGSVIRPIMDGSASLRVEVMGVSPAEVPIEVDASVTNRPWSYRHDVAALLSKAGCNMGACHGNLNGKGGLKLSLRGENPAFDLLALTRENFGRRINRHDPDSSLIVRKATGRAPHEGGLRFRPDSPEANALRGWIASGAVDDGSTVPKVVRLTVFPQARLNNAPGREQQLVVTAEFADGTSRDVTRQAAFDLDDPTRAEVTPEGLVQVRAPGEVAVAVRYLNGRGVSRLGFLHDRPDFAWNGPEPANVVDEHVFAKLRSLKINPSERATDATFVRRATLDTLGILPTPGEVRAYLDNEDPDKRIKLVDALLERPEFADYWALKWADLLRNEEKSMGTKGVWVLQRWLRDQIASDVPLDQFARAIVAGLGSTYQNPPASFYRTNRSAESAAESLGQVFLGVRLQCARCHNHPFDVWTQDDYYGLAAYFANIDLKVLDKTRRDDLDSHEINGDVIVHRNGRPRMRQPNSGEMMRPTPLGGDPAEIGQSDPDALVHLADWLTRDNRQFARNLANRAWSYLLGRGIVDPVDDFRESNPPLNPALLEAITDHLIDNELRLRPLVRLILTSETYGLSATPNDTNLDDTANFARATVKPLPAEVLYDAISDALDARSNLVAQGSRRGRDAPPGAPEFVRAVRFPGVRGGDFLKVFGKPERLLTCECERSESTTLAQAFQLINGEAVRDRLEARENRISRLIRAGLPDDALLDELYLASLSRLPSEEERLGALAHVATSVNRRRAWEDVAWALLNSKEFLLRH